VLQLQILLSSTVKEGLMATLLGMEMQGQRVAVIGIGGIGLPTAQICAELGAELVLADRQSPSAAAEDIQKTKSASASFRSPEKTVRQDWSALSCHLERNGLHLDWTAEPRQFSGGLANLNYLVMINDEQWVLRRPPPGKLPPGANDMQREYTILKSLWQAYPLAPKAIHFSEDRSVLGAPFLIMQYRPGIVIGGSLPESRAISEQEREALGQCAISLLANLHSVDAASIGLSSLGKPEGMLARMVDGWEKRAHYACGGDMPKGITRTVNWLRSRIPATQAACLLHSDFKLDNMILDPATLEPRAVIDWDMGTRGDPLVDLGTLLSYWTEAGDPEAMHQLAQMPTAQPGFPTRDELIEMYARETGCDLSCFRFYRVVCMLKLCVVFMQLHARYIRGEAVPDKYKTFGKLALGLLDFTESIASGNSN
jgi:aminoglycoside phosphotransferase (APT) family kinase protein